MQGDLDTVEELLGADAALANARGFAIETTPLILAAHRGFDDLCEVLLGAGADVRAREGASDSSPLHWAAEGGHRKVVKLLLEHGADATTPDAWYGLAPLGWTAVPQLMPDVHDDRGGVASDLLAAGSPLDPFTAVVHGREDAITAEMLAARLGVAGRGWSPLHFAVQAAPEPAISTLLHLGADPTLADSWGVSALAVARALRDDVAHRLEARGEDPSAELVRTGKADRLPPIDEAPGLLHFCVQVGHLDAVRHLLSVGVLPSRAIPALANEQLATLTPLIAAAERGHVEIASLLLEAGAPADQRPEETGISALHVAASRGDARMARLLLDHGADRTLQDVEHEATPSEWATFFGHLGLAPHLAAED